MILFNIYMYIYLYIKSHMHKQILFLCFLFTNTFLGHQPPSHPYIFSNTNTNTNTNSYTISRSSCHYYTRSMNLLWSFPLFPPAPCFQCPLSNKQTMFHSNLLCFTFYLSCSTLAALPASIFSNPKSHLLQLCHLQLCLLSVDTATISRSRYTL